MRAAAFPVSQWLRWQDALRFTVAGAATVAGLLYGSARAYSHLIPGALHHSGNLAGIVVRPMRVWVKAESDRMTRAGDG